MPAPRKVVVIGLDGLEPKIVDSILEAGELPHLARLRVAGGYSRVALFLAPRAAARATLPPRHFQELTTRALGGPQAARASLRYSFGPSALCRCAV